MNTFIKTILLTVLCLAGSSQAQMKVDICKLLDQSNAYEGLVVRTIGFVHAEYHSTDVRNPDCKGRIVVRYDPVAQPKNFVFGAEGVRSKFDKRPFLVTVEGKFEGNVCARTGCFRRINIDRVLKSEFVEAETAAVLAKYADSTSEK